MVAVNWQCPWSVWQLFCSNTERYC